MIDLKEKFGIVFDKLDTSYCESINDGEFIEECHVLFDESSKQFVTESGEKLCVHDIHMSKKMNYLCILLRSAEFDFQCFPHFNNYMTYSIAPFLEQQGIRVRDLDLKKRRSRKGAAL